MINNEVLRFIKESKINEADAICYLLSIHYGYRPSYIPEELKLKINALGLFTIDRYNTIQWNIALLENQEINFSWVKDEYVSLFKKANPQKGGHVREATKLMKSFFASNPDIRKEEVIEATKFYLQVTDSSYIRFPHFFIQKGVGLSQTNDLIDWIEKYRESIKSQQEESSLGSNLMK
jgi:hypothetical protein